MKKLSKVLSFLLILLTISSSILASNVEVNVNGENKSLVTEIRNGRTFVRVQDLKSFGLTNEVQKEKIKLKSEDVEIVFTLNDNSVSVNNVNFTIDSKSYKKDNKYFVPLRFILETLNYKIEWNHVKRSVIATKNEEIKFPISISDGQSNYLVEKKANTVVSLAPGVTEKLFSIGAGDKILGRTKYCTYPDEAKKIEDIGTLYTPNLERIIEINPDVVIAETHFKKEILDKMNEAGIETFAASTPSEIEDIYEFTLKLGAIVGKNYEARALVSSMKSKVERIKYVLNNVKEQEKPTVYYVLGTGQYGEYTAGKGTFISEMINISGGLNVADDVNGWSYSLEKLIDNDPDIIFGSDYNIKSMISSDNYKILSSIKNKTYKIVDENLFSIPGPRAINEGLKVLIEMFHKDKLSDLNF